MVRALILLFLANVALLTYALIDCLSTDRAEVRNFSKLVWVPLIVLLSPIGSIAWLLAGRPRRTTSRRSPWLGAGSPGSSRPRPLAPDDDPDFLRGLNTWKPDDEDGTTPGKA